MKKLSGRRIAEAVEEYLGAEGPKSLPGLALRRNLTSGELAGLLEREDGRRRALRMACTAIERELAEGAMQGRYNATITSFLLKCWFAYREKRSEGDAPAEMRVELSDELKKYAQ